MEEKEIIPIHIDSRTDIKEDSVDDFYNRLINACHFDAVEIKELSEEIKRNYPHILAMYDPSDDVIYKREPATATPDEETDYAVYIQLAFAMRYRQLFLQKRVSSEVIESIQYSKTVSFENELEVLIEILGFAKLMLSQYSNHIIICAEDDWEIKDEYKVDLKDKVELKAIEIMQELMKL